MSDLISYRLDRLEEADKENKADIRKLRAEIANMKIRIDQLQKMKAKRQ